MPELISQTIAGCYTLLRSPSQVKLPYEIVRERLNDILTSYVEDEQFTTNDRRVQVTAVTFDVSEPDYVMKIDVPDYEVQKLEYKPGTGDRAGWSDIQIVSLDAWEQYFGGSRLVAAFYGSDQVPGGRKVKFNLTQPDVADAEWQLTYRLPLATVLQLGDIPPLPLGHMPLVRYDLAIDCMPLVLDDSESWLKWMERTKPDYIARVANLRIKWQKYLDQSVGQHVQRLPAFNDFRRGQRVGTRGYVPIQ